MALLRNRVSGGKKLLNVQEARNEGGIRRRGVLYVLAQKLPPKLFADGGGRGSTEKKKKNIYESSLNTGSQRGKGCGPRDHEEQFKALRGDWEVNQEID